MKREKFGSRLGFILISAGCAIGLGNVGDFHILPDNTGGAAFCADLPVFPVNTGTSDHGHGVLGRACESGKYCAFL